MPGHIGMESHSGNMSAAANVNSSVDNNSVDAVRQAEEFLRQMMGGNIM